LQTLSRGKIFQPISHPDKFVSNGSLFGADVCPDAALFDVNDCQPEAGSIDLVSGM